MTALSVLVVSTPVGPIGSGIGGGVELTLRNLVEGLTYLGHRVEVVVPMGSTPLSCATHQIAGTLQPSSQMQNRAAVPALPHDSVLENMWNFAASRQSHFDVIVNLAYDALPFECSGVFPTPVVHLVSMGSLSDAMDAVINDALRNDPRTVAMHSRAQAATFVNGASATIVGSGVRMSDYVFAAESDIDGPLGFVGRIAPEKGLADAVEVAAISGRRLLVWGFMQDEDCWNHALAAQPTAKVEYRGFLETSALQSELGRCAGIVVSSRWVEAFGNVVIEGLACGVPAVVYDRGGPAEIVEQGVTGLVVPPDNPVAMAAAIADLGTISRQRCRSEAEARFSSTAFAKRVEAWLRGSIGPG